MEIAGPSEPGGRGRGGRLCRRLEVTGATPIPVAAVATPIPVAAGVVSPALVPGGRGRGRNRNRSRRRKEAGGAATVSMAEGAVTNHSPVINSVHGDCTQARAQDKLNELLTAYRLLELKKLPDDSEKNIESEIQSTLRQLQKVDSQRQTSALSQVSKVLPHSLSVEDLTKEFYRIRSSLRAKRQPPERTSANLKEQTAISAITEQKFDRIRSSLRAKHQHAFPVDSRNCEIEDVSVNEDAYSPDQVLLKEQTETSTSTEQLQANMPNQEDPQPIIGRKRKIRKVHDISFEICRVLVNPAKKLYAHRVGKSTNLAKAIEDVHSFPYVNFKKERDGNNYAFHIMAFLWHNSILRLKSIVADKSDKSGKGLVAFVEPVRGTMDSLCSPENCVDNYGYIPTDTLRVAVREIVSGLCFLWMNGCYHGNLNWNTTYYNSENSVKLANFESREPLSKEEARIMDRNCLVSMLQHVSNQATLINPNCSTELLHLLIDTLNTTDLTSPNGLETSILDNSFFWTASQKTDFLANNISMKMRDQQFVNRLPADLCLFPWTTSYDQEFIALVKSMNEFRERKGWAAYKERSVEHFVNCICGLYAHKEMIQERKIDRIVSRNLPLLIEKLRRLL